MLRCALEGTLFRSLFVRLLVPPAEPGVSDAAASPDPRRGMGASASAFSSSAAAATSGSNSPASSASAAASSSSAAAAAAAAAAASSSSSHSHAAAEAAAGSLGPWLARLRRPYSLPTQLVSLADADTTPGLPSVQSLLLQAFGIGPVTPAQQATALYANITRFTPFLVSAVTTTTSTSTTRSSLNRQLSTFPTRSIPTAPPQPQRHSQQLRSPNGTPNNSEAPTTLPTTPKPQRHP